MQELYFNRLEFLKACDLIHTNPIEAKNLFEKYIRKYPNDYSAQNYYVFLLIVLGEIDEACAYIEAMEYSMSYNSKFCNHADKMNYANKGIFINKIRLLARLEEYDELYSYYLKHRDIYNEYDLQLVPFYCRNKLGLINKDKQYSSYLFGQIANYSYDEFVKHVERHTADYNMYLDNPNSSIFIPSFPLDKVLEEIKKYIPSDKGLGYGFFEDTYVFRFYECGRVKNKLTDYFKVICFRDTNNLITMCPSENCENFPYTDLNYLVNEDKPKIKTLSQIEKFNKRYRR